MKAFLSYSHKDEWALERLHTHLANLRRDGQITEWFDREILAGGDIDREISVQLDACDLFLPLVSPDFLNSNYCYEQEMERAIRRHSEGLTRIVPIIVEPCDWKSTPLKQFKVLPRDGLPIADWTNRNTAFLDIVNELRRLISERPISDPSAAMKGTEEHSTTAVPRYRAKKDFDEIDKAEFRKASFETFREYFRSSVDEINDIDGMKARFTEINSLGFTCTVLNQGRDLCVAHITVHAKSGRFAMGDIYYSFNENAPPDTASGAFAIQSDEYDLFLKAIFSPFSNTEELLAPTVAAEDLWLEFLQHAGISYD